MPGRRNTDIRKVRTFEQLLEYLADELEWPVEEMTVEELTFDYDPENDLGLDPKTAAKIRSIKQLREVDPRQPFGIFFVEFEPRSLPVVALRRILARLVTRKRASANPADRKSWEQDDLLFISACGEDSTRRIDFAHFAPDAQNGLPTLRVLGWDADDRQLKADHIVATLREKLAWPEAGELNINEWRIRWREAFVLRPREVIETSKALAIRLADLARSIRERVKASIAIETENGPLRKLMRAFRESLIHDLKEDDFADMYAQTIAYGLLSARISRPGAIVADNLVDMVPITNPFLKELLGTFINLGGRKWSAEEGRIVGIDFDELGVNEVVETLRQTNMEAVLRDFDNRNPQEDPVIHFYELFLKEYDAKKRMQRGVFYTPKPVVSYIVRSVHELLQTEFGLEDGLADTATWGDMLARNPHLKLPEVETIDPQTRRAGQRPIDPSTPFVQILDPATGTATFLVEVIEVIHTTMLEKWKREGVRGELFLNQKWNEYVPRHLLPRLHGYELMMAPYAIAHMKIGLKLFETGYEFASDERARVYLTNALEPPRQFQATFDIAALAHEADAVNRVKRESRFTVVIGNPPYAKLSSNLAPAAVGFVEPFRYLDGERITERGALAHEINLQDDYVKFYGFMFRSITDAGVGLGSFISNFRYLDSTSLRGYRQYVLQHFGRVHVLNLGGHIADRNTLDDVDENVFDIEQGVAVGAFVRPTSSAAATTVQYGRLYGTRQSKSDLLAASVNADLCPDAVAPRSPFYTFRPAGGVEEDEFRAWPSLDQMFPDNSGCVITSRDNLAIGFTRDELLATIRRFAASGPGDLQIQREIGFSVKAKWDVEACKRLIRRHGVSESLVRPILYRPFDIRYIYYLPQLLDTPSRPVSELLTDGDNCVLLTPKIKTTPVFCHVLASRHTAEKKACSHDRATQMFPLWTRTLGGRTSNVTSQQFLANQHDGPDVVLGYIYAILHSHGYRQRYGQVLREVFPHIPPIKNSKIAQVLSDLGSEIVSLHLLESSIVETPIATYRGLRSPAIDKVSYSSETVWLDKTKTSSFVGVPEEVWNFHIGGYQVCHKWLKDRKGRTLSDEDIAHYQKIVVALKETIRIMAEIDEVIDAHGGWPGAFVTDRSDSGTKGGA